MLDQFIVDKEFFCDKVVIEETLSFLYLTINFGEKGKTLPTELLHALKGVSSRDSFEFFFEISGDIVSVSSCDESSFQLIQDHLHNNTLEDDCEIELKIKKEVVSSICSVYFLKSFISSLVNKTPLEQMKIFSSALDPCLYIEVFSVIDEFGTKGIWFFSSFSECKYKVKISQYLRDYKIASFIENSGYVQVPGNIIPEDFYIIKGGVKELDDLFCRLCGVLSLAFLVNELSVSDSWEVSYKVSGYKTILVHEESCTRISDKSDLIYRLYEWAYEGGSNSDKLGLIRNVLSIHIDGNGKIKFDKEVWEAVQSNYQIYLKNNIESYLDVKNKISEMVIEFTGRTYVIADSVLDSFKNNVFLMITFLLTVVVINGLKDGGVHNIFSSVYLGVVIILTVISYFWLAMSKREAKNRFNHASDSVSNILHINYKNIVMESEINECTKPIIKNSKDYLYSQVDRYSRWWAVILVVFLLSFLVAHFLFNWEAYLKNEPANEVKGSHSYNGFLYDSDKCGQYGGISNWIYLENSNCLYCTGYFDVDIYGLISYANKKHVR